MKNLKYIAGTALAVCVFFTQTVAQGVTIGSPNPPDPSATLEVAGNTGGFLLPRLTTAERNQISNPAIGLQVYNTTTQCIEAFFPSGWKQVTCDCSLPPPAPAQIIGATHLCPGNAGQLFYVAPVPGAMSYMWVINNQDTLVGSSSNDSIWINFSNNPGVRTIGVLAINSCGNSQQVTLPVDISNPQAQFSVNPAQPQINNPAVFTTTTVGVTSQWTFMSGSPSSSNSSPENVIWTSTGTYSVSLIVTDNAGCSDTLNSTVNVINCLPTVYSFTTCGATGRYGPNQTQANATYGNGVVTVNGGIQEWVVPQSGTYRILAVGARGGRSSGYNHYGRGASMQGEFTFNQGDVLHILVGQQGTDVVSGSCGGAGGGGSFVTNQNNAPLIAAGGGSGGGNYSSPNYSIMDGRTTSYGPTYQSTGRPTAGGGAGSFNASGLNTNGGTSFLAGGFGGGDTYPGGFGGGGGHYASNSYASGGGGYSGGDEIHGTNLYQANEGGGGSYNAGVNQVNTAGANAGHGYVTITRICP